jgi:small subunit ribosomal protein S2
MTEKQTPTQISPAMDDSSSIAQEIEVKLPTAEQLLEAGVHFGHRTSKWNPKMKKYIFGVKNTVHVFDLEKTLEALKKAAQFTAGLAQKGEIILFVGTKPAVREIVKQGAIAAGMPYVSNRWLGGTLTNFKTISRRLDYYKKLEKDFETGEMEKYTKKERLNFQKDLEELKKNFEGIKDLIKLPKAVLVADILEDEIALKEAKKIGISIIAVCDTNTNPVGIDYPIPANDDASSSIKIIMDTIVEGIKGIEKK